MATGIASSAAVAAGFGIGLTTLWRWKAPHDARSARTPGCWTRNASCSPTPSRWPPITPSPPWPGCCARTTPRADDEARALLREAFTLSGDLHITGDTLHVRLNPAAAPAAAARCTPFASSSPRPEPATPVSYTHLTLPT